MKHERRTYRASSAPRGDVGQPWLYLAIALGWTWLCWFGIVMAGWSFDAQEAVLLYALGGIGPPLAALGLLYASGSVRTQRDYWRRLFDVRRIGGRWWAAALLLPLAFGLLGLLGEFVHSGSMPAQDLVRGALAEPFRLVPLLLFLLLFGPLPEEMGWRGYALEYLQRRWTALSASLIIAAAWALWHLPLFFIEGTYHDGLGVGTMAFFFFLIGLVPDSVLMTWIYNHTGRSTLSAVLFHFATNITGELLLLTERADVYRTGGALLAAVLVVVFYGYRTLGPAGRVGKEDG